MHVDKAVGTVYFYRPNHKPWTRSTVRRENNRCNSTYRPGKKADKHSRSIVNRTVLVFTHFIIGWKDSVTGKGFQESILCHCASKIIGWLQLEAWRYNTPMESDFLFPLQWMYGYWASWSDWSEKMFSLTSSMSYYLYNGATDMRKSFDGLCGLVESRLTRNPMSGEVFIFINKRRDHIKLLHWETGGFILYYKRLESGTIELPRWDPVSSCYPLLWSDLMMMIEGISLDKIRRRKRYILTKQCV